jgi:hypothetical protein
MMTDDIWRRKFETTELSDGFNGLTSEHRRLAVDVAIASGRIRTLGQLVDAFPQAAFSLGLEDGVAFNRPDRNAPPLAL